MERGKTPALGAHFSLMASESLPKHFPALIYRGSSCRDQSAEESTLIQIVLQTEPKGRRLARERFFAFCLPVFKGFSLATA
jgi:hypothetical protein